MDSSSKKQFNKKRFVYLVIAVIMFIGAVITFQKWWAKAGIGMMGSSSVGDMYFSDNTLYYGSRWHGICAYNEKTSTDSILIKNAEISFLIDDEYIYYKKGNKDYKYNINTAQIEKSEKHDEEFYYTNIKSTPEVNEVLKKSKNDYGDISYGVLSGEYLYAKHARSGGYISIYDVENGKMIMGADGRQGRILEHSYSPVGMLMSGLGGINFSSPMSLLWFSSILLPIPFLILGIVFIKKRRALENN